MGSHRESVAAPPQNSTHSLDLASLLAEGLERFRQRFSSIFPCSQNGIRSIT